MVYLNAFAIGGTSGMNVLASLIRSNKRNCFNSRLANGCEKNQKFKIKNTNMITNMIDGIMLSMNNVQNTRRNTG